MEILALLPVVWLTVSLIEKSGKSSPKNHEHDSEKFCSWYQDMAQKNQESLKKDIERMERWKRGES